MARASSQDPDGQGQFSRGADSLTVATERGGERRSCAEFCELWTFENVKIIYQLAVSFFEKLSSLFFLLKMSEFFLSLHKFQEHRV